MDIIKNKTKENPKFVEADAQREVGGGIAEDFFHWRAPEFEVYEKDRRWYLAISVILLLIIGYAVWSNSPVMAITFILIGMVGYLYTEKDPKILDFKITSDGVITGKEIYEFEQSESFWIFYEPPYKKVLSLRVKSHLMPYVHIPIHDEDPVKIREILLQYIPEVKQEPSLIDTFERLLHI